MGKPIRADKGRFAGSEPDHNAINPPVITKSLPTSTKNNTADVATPLVSSSSSVEKLYKTFQKNFNWTSTNDIERKQAEFLAQLDKKAQSEGISQETREEAFHIIEQAMAEHRSSPFRPGSRDYDPSPYLDELEEGLEMLGVEPGEASKVALPHTFPPLPTQASNQTLT